MLRPDAVQAVAKDGTYERRAATVDEKLDCGHRAGERRAAWTRRTMNGTREKEYCHDCMRVKIEGPEQVE